MKNFFFPTSILALFTSVLTWTPLPAQRTCGTPEYVKYLSEKHPELREKRRLVEEKAKEGFQFKMAANSVVTIPVVVHVVFNNPQENISDEQIYNQIAVLNKDFRRLNVDADNTPDPFEPFVADVQIQFCLASVDPVGNPTSGITRTATMHGPFLYPTDDMKYTALGGIDAWDTDRYLNIWVCNTDVLGYAPYPGTAPAAEDGVVVDFAAMGIGGAAAPPYNLGRTATHEVGHWLNLVHIWGDATCGDDQVADTPIAENANFGCPAFPRVTSCGNGPDGEMFMNYMDYVDDQCMFMFTAGQKSRMLATFTSGGGREGLLSSGGCGGACPRALFLTDEFVATAMALQASDLIMAWNNITGGSNIEYQAGDSIVLKPGFHAQSGNIFRAWINGCAGPKPSERSSEPTQVLSGFTCYPNPFAETLYVQFELTASTSASFSLLDVHGRTVFLTPAQRFFGAGQHTTVMTVGQLPAGIYYVEMRTPAERKMQRVIKVNH
ncbi:MAG: M43 family zinc metalloprotease [Saprospiraceae bacterium]|nr:M43 family zinc metalloprotease [Saprospiraceae bacterium]MDW8230362.1 M43 family zinc metalloprotease [Saprospiraceae bacterium]